MIRPVVAAILALALALVAPTAPAGADARVGARTAGAPITINRLRDLLERDRTRVRKRDLGRIGAFAHRHDGPDSRRRQRGPAGSGDAHFLPDRCYDAVRTRWDTLAGYGPDCMRAAVARPSDLPPHCLAQARGPRAFRTLYDARCLRSQGWTSRAARR